jgi:protein involved in polysaccharide export with SLBB domain
MPYGTPLYRGRADAGRQRLMRSRAAAAALVCAALMSGCNPARAERDETPSGLTIGAGDRLTVVVFGQAELTGDYLVADDGQILMPLVGGIEVSGLTLPDVQKRIASRLADGFLKEPIVGTRVAEHRPIFVVGDVKSPGSFPFRYGATVLGGIALAGGYGRIEMPGGDRTAEFLLADERVRSLETRLASLSVKAARLAAQRDGAGSFELPFAQPGIGEGEARQLVLSERQMFDSDRTALAKELETLAKQRPRIEADISATKEQLEAEKTQLEGIRDHIAGFKQLMESGYARRYTGIELQREEARRDEPDCGHPRELADRAGAACRTPSAGGVRIGARRRGQPEDRRAPQPPRRTATPARRRDHGAPAGRHRRSDAAARRDAQRGVRTLGRAEYQRNAMKRIPHENAPSIRTSSM